MAPAGGRYKQPWFLIQIHSIILLDIEAVTVLVLKMTRQYTALIILLSKRKLSMKRRKYIATLIFAVILAGSLQSAFARSDCNDLPNHNQLRSALSMANDLVDLAFNNEVWGAVVADDGTVCAVAFTGQDALQSQWLAGRVIAAQKANTANAMSLGNSGGGANAGMALSSANLWTAVQPGGYLSALQYSNPVDASVAYTGNEASYGLINDPMNGKRIGGINVSGGGLALYNTEGVRVGGVGVSGDTPCRDHMVAWETRHALELDFVTKGVSGDAARPDNIIFDLDNAFGHPHCGDDNQAVSEAAVAENLTAVQGR